jgi:LysM repeat protein
VNISRLGRSLCAAALVSVTVSAAALAQDTKTDAATHTVKRGDTLWDLAKRYLNDAYLWPEIYRINTDQIEDPHWIYPGEILRLPGKTAAPTIAATPEPTQTPAQTPVRQVSSAVTVFTPRTLVFGRTTARRQGPPPRVAIGDVMSAPFYAQIGGPSGAGKITFGYDLPGIDKPHPMANYHPYVRLLMIPPTGSSAAVRDRFIAYQIGPTEEGLGTMVIPTALLQVIRAPVDNEPAIVEVRQLYGMLDADTKVIPLDTTGAGATGIPVAVPASSAQTASLIEVYRPAVLPSLGHYVLFNLSARDGMRIGDEVQVYRSRAEPKGDDGPTLPEVPIASAQVVRVTPYGATARVTSQQQPAIRKGEHVRVTARMP